MSTQARLDVYGRPDCPHCDRVKAHLERHRIPFRYHDIQKHPWRRTQMEKRANQYLKTVPQVFSGEKLIGGADDTMALPVDVLQMFVAGG